MTAGLRELRRRLRARASAKDARVLQRFFKTGPGEYGEGDLFLGVRVPELRRLARQSDGLARGDALALLKSRHHEERLLALLILVRRFERGSPAEQEWVYEACLRHTRHINNWDLVDLSAPSIVGAWLLRRDRSLLDRLAASPFLWERRIAVLATLAFIRQGQFDDTLRLCASLLEDQEDLIHKACGWMLREAGKRNPAALEGFLRQYVSRMPRTMLRYAIERLPKTRRKAWLKA
jgi:3-methyladenine DNA glycosylase AlkD